MEKPPSLEVLRQGSPPSCLKVGGLICGGLPWRGALIHCPVSGFADRVKTAA